MSLSGLKKQFNKANQYMSERIGGVKGTELDDEFYEMEKKTDVIEKLCKELDDKVHEYLQPNPTTRAKLATQATFAKMRGSSRDFLYPQPEGELGEVMVKFGTQMGQDSFFGSALVETGEAHRQLAELKYTLEENVRSNFIQPIRQLESKDIKEISHHRKKVESRRLDFDCKRRVHEKAPTTGSSKVDEEEVKIAQEKFEESKRLCETAMFNILENDVEQISQLHALVQAELEYHRQSAQVLDRLSDSLKQKRNVASSKPRRDHVPKKVSVAGGSSSSSQTSLNQGGRPQIQVVSAQPVDGGSALAVRTPAAASNDGRTISIKKATATNQVPTARALYDFDAENQGELSFKEGDTIRLVQQIDENWYEGELKGRTGFFPVNYVDVIVPLK